MPTGELHDDVRVIVQHGRKAATQQVRRLRDGLAKGQRADPALSAGTRHDVEALGVEGRPAAGRECEDVGVRGRVVQRPAQLALQSHGRPVQHGPARRLQMPRRIGHEDVGSGSAVEDVPEAQRVHDHIDGRPPRVLGDDRERRQDLTEA